MKKVLTDIDGALTRIEAFSKPPQKTEDNTFDIYTRLDGQLGMGNKIQINGEILKVDDTEHHLAPGLIVLMTQKRPHLHSVIMMIIKHTKDSLHRPRLDYFRIKLQTPNDHAARGNGNIYSREWLYLGKG